MNLERIERSVNRYRRTLRENEQCLVLLKGRSGGSYIIPSLFSPGEISHIKQVWGALGAEFLSAWNENSELASVMPIREFFECFLDLTLELSWT